MPTTDTVVPLSLPRNHVGQTLDGLYVLVEQWQATAMYLRAGEAGDAVIRECSDAEEADWIARLYTKIAADVRSQMRGER